MSKNNQKQSLHASELRRKKAKFPVLHAMTSFALLSLALLASAVRRGSAILLGKGSSKATSQQSAAIVTSGGSTTSGVSAMTMSPESSNDELSAEYSGAPCDRGMSGGNNISSRSDPGCSAGIRTQSGKRKQRVGESAADKGAEVE